MARIAPWFVMPLVTVVAYFILFWTAPEIFARWAQGESGLVEVATALLFAAAAVEATRLARLPIPSVYRALFIGFSALTFLVMLEEISYGQHLIGWLSPEFFAQYNSQGETNFHNMLASTPGKRMTRLADLGSLFGFVVLPVLASRLRGWRNGRLNGPIHHLIPGLELAGLVLLARAVAAFKDLSGAAPDLNELRELLWAWAAFGYVVVIYRRLRPASRALANDWVAEAVKVAR